ncbi:MAG: tRNA (guanosine(46)-N7)-methyltransferase TrmB [Myxococcota bacterium]
MNPAPRCRVQSVWHHVFGRRAPLELEIGCGRGDFLLQRAASRPQHNVVGIECKTRLVRHINARKQRLGLTNVHVVHGDAWAWVPTTFAATEITALFLNFPDPWWKKRHAKRRILPRWFVHVLSSKAMPGAGFFLQTDVCMTFRHCLQALRQDGLWHHCQGDAGAAFSSNPAGTQSYRERRCLKQGIPVYRAALTRTLTQPPPRR